MSDIARITPFYSKDGLDGQQWHHLGSLQSLNFRNTPVGSCTLMFEKHGLIYIDFLFKHVLPETPRIFYPSMFNHKMLLEMKNIKQFLKRGKWTKWICSR